MGKTQRSPPSQGTGSGAVVKTRSKSEAESQIKTTPTINNNNVKVTGDIKIDSVKKLCAPKSIASVASQSSIGTCNNCVNIVDDVAEIKNTLLILLSKNDKIMSNIDDLKNIVNKLTSVSNSLSVNPLVPSTVNNVSFSEVLKSANKSKPVLVLKPRNESQSRKQTFNDVNEKLDPNCVAVNNIHHASNGGLVIECKSAEDTLKLKDIAMEKLGDGYSVNVPKKRSPMIRIVGMTSFYEDEQLLQIIKDHNSELFSSLSHLKIIQRYSFSKSATYGVKLEVDAESFTNCMVKQRIRVFWQMCNVYEAFGIIRCFKCNEFNHVANKCTSTVSCAKCSGSHVTTECTSSVIQCVNCIKAAAALKINIDTSHPAWSDNCSVFLEKVKLEKRRINYESSKEQL